MLNIAPRFFEPSYSDDVDFSGFQGTYEAEEVEVEIDGCVLMIPAIEVCVYGIDVSYDETDVVWEFAVVTDIRGQKRRLSDHDALGRAVGKWIDSNFDAIRDWAAERVRWDS